MKMIRFNILLYSLVFSFYAIGLRGQNKVEDGINNSFMFCRDYPMERVYLHFDNTSYYLGEKIRYKGYIVVLDSATSLSISKVLHVELLNQFGQLLDKQNVRIENGAACGDFDLAPQNLPGYYEVRAYTRWMMNFGENNYFSRVFPCYAAAEPPGEFKKELFKYRLDISMKMRPSTSDDKMDIRFYPEGGQLVTDIPSTVAFQITSPKDVSPQIGRVDIYSSANLLIDTCRVVHNGMGRFRYCPSDKPGYISFVYKDKKYKYDLLDATPRGVCLSVSRLSDDSVTVSIFKNTGQTDTLGVCLTSGGIIYKAAEVVSDDSRIQLKFPLEQLPCGVAQVLLLDGGKGPLCQRMFFVNHPEKYINIHCRKKKNVYAPGEKAELDFEVSDMEEKGCQTDFSLAVRATATSDLTIFGDNIRSNLLLSSELKGYIHQPEYYFLPSGKVRDEELDLLLLVQGWSKYDWEKRMRYAATDNPQYMLEQSLILKGYLKNSFGKLQAHAKINMLVQDTMATFMTAMTDKEGFFSFPLDGINGKYTAILQAFNPKGVRKNRRFLLERNFTPPLRAYESEEMCPLWDNLPQADSLELEREEQKEMEKYKSEGVVLNEVVIKKKRMKLTLKEYDRSIIACYNIRQMVESYLDKGKKYVSLAHLLIENGTNFRWNPTGMEPSPDEALSSKYKKSASLSTALLYKGKDAFWAIDGILFNGAGSSVRINQLLMSNPAGLKSLTILEGSSAYKYINEAQFNEQDRVESNNIVSFMGMGNVALISIETEQGLDFFFKYPPSPRMRVINVEGYAQPDEFFSPDYGNASLPIEKDHRRTLYWNPSVHTDENGKAHVEFYNSFKFTTLNINAEAATADGRLGSLNMY